MYNQAMAEPSLKRILGGTKARQNGIGFEYAVDLCAKLSGITLIELPSLGAKRVGGRIGRLIPQKMPFDRILVYRHSVVFFDCKTFDSDHITHSQLIDHQIEILNAIEQQGLPAGYLIYFRPSNAVTFVQASRLVSLNPRESIQGSDMMWLGQIESFDLKKLFYASWAK